MQKYLITLAIEIISVAVSMALLGYLVYFLLNKTLKKKLDVKLLVLVLAITGGLTHFLFEVTGLNKWYLKNGASTML